MSIRLKYSLWLIAASLIFYYPFLGGVHLFDWDEINFAEIAREMIISGDYLRPTINFEPFWEKPPLFIWMQVLSMKMFGINEFAARFPNAVCGTLTLLALFSMGSRLRNEKFGFWWALAYLGSILPHLYFKSGIIDPWFNLFIFSGLYRFYRYKTEDFQHRHIVYSAIFIGLAVLTKGPVALALFGLTAALIYLFTGFRQFVRPLALLLWLLVFVLTIGTWYGAETLVHGPWFMEQFLVYQVRLFSTEDAGHGGFAGYHFIVLLFGCFPASAFALPTLFKKTDAYEKNGRLSFLFMQKVLLLLVLVLFSVVKTKIVHYSSLAYFPLTYLAAAEILRILEQKKPLHILSKIALPLTGFIFGLAVLALPLAWPYKDQFINQVQDMTARNSLRDIPIHFAWYTYLPGPFILLTIIGSHYLYKVMPVRSLQLLFLGSAIGISATIYAFIGRIEQFSQSIPIRYFIEKQRNYVAVYGYKSYAHLFYGNTQHVMPPATDVNSSENMFVVAKESSLEEIRARYPEWQLREMRGGWLLYFKPAPYKGN
ncbi:MAG: glycosyltransferase family 39 protein [Bacteroidia bacterium]|nr:glycosyltransferase family 39 protein [Bacteroidia bacterium]